ncbi:hypothetical protein IVB18_14300 [Bradyrhizobium sp. 186]|uniref:hypothetical protein n=1 Tax=Bradyrhizobium sp. 186 TaxID=2782654 RepID=UPI002001C0A4|nr:hypothetical protein [Bradyrhizobium sp. 186]UPK38306.1 hypothetical protein IVB18_14300 [Bradyrhizobium sp. 186]
MTAQLGCYLRYASACPGQLEQLLDLALGPLLWFLYFHGAALNLPPLNQCALGDLRVVSAGNPSDV